MTGGRAERGSDVWATLMWGLRRYAVLVLAMVLLLGVLVPFLLSRRTAEYTATAQVGPSKPLLLPNTTPLPRFAESVFNNGAVEETVRGLLNQANGNVIPSKVQLIAAQDNVVLDVVAHARTAKQAIDIANAAAATLMFELNKYSDSVTTFTTQHNAILAKKVPKVAGGSMSVALGLLAGLLGGVALVGLLLVFRRPVVDASTVQEVTGSPVIGRVSLPRHGPPDASTDRGVGLLCRRLLGTPATAVNVAAPHSTQAQMLATSMTEVFGKIRTGRRPQKRPNGTTASPVPKVQALDDAELWVSAPEEQSYTLLMAPEGISTRKLRLLAEGYDTGAPTGVVMVTRTRTRGRLKPLVLKG
ncbi:hypothetical protein [Nocardioides cynanchi]|uniref:hypothetical protein n=1 Tax=Nocardioides cynanchi TaxID=2558918 RepID=UPI001244AC9E|nr:hypothetical protein [Nocardioides cynanchi]